MKITLLIPTLNEIDGMKVIMPRIDRDWVDQILVLDGGSDDGTVEFARQSGYEVYVQKKRGMRHAYTEVWPRVTGDVVITFSPDGNSVPELIPDLIRKMREGFDMVIVSRYLGDARSDDDDFVTRFGNWLFTRSINLVHAARYTDAMVIFRAYRKRIIYDLGLDRDDGYRTPERLFKTRISWEPLLSIRAAKAGLKVSEIPGDEPARVGGVRKLQVVRWGAAYYYQILREYFAADGTPSSP